MDLNGDGVGDILSGSYSRMDSNMAGLFQVLSGQSDGSFKKAEVLKGTDDEPLIIPIKSREDQVQNICTRPTATDWDHDGDLDLVVGNFAGSFYLFIGKGDGQFLPEPEQIMSGDKPLQVTGAHSDPFLVDWDQDGDVDIVSGSSSGGVYWAENTAGPGKTPELKQFITLIEAGSQIAYGQPISEDELVGPSNSTRVWVDDVNSDGKLDILVGDNVSLVSPAEGLTAEEFKTKFDEWQEAIKTATPQEISKLYQDRSKFMREERTGFVWLFVQK